MLNPREHPYFRSIAVKFPGERVVAFDRVGIWVEGDRVRLAMCPAELKAQYTRVYSDTAKVEALIYSSTHAGCTLEPSFQLAHRFGQPIQRW